MLYYTSFCFGTVAFHAARVGHTWLHAASLLQYGLSVLHHAKGCGRHAYLGSRLVAFLDRSVAHAAVVRILWDASRGPAHVTATVGSLMAYTAAVYYVHLRGRAMEAYGPLHEALHGSIHVAACAAAHVMLCWHRGG